MWSSIRSWTARAPVTSLFRLSWRLNCHFFPKVEAALPSLQSLFSANLDSSCIDPVLICFDSENQVKRLLKITSGQFCVALVYHYTLRAPPTFACVFGSAPFFVVIGFHYNHAIPFIVVNHIVFHCNGRHRLTVINEVLHTKAAPWWNRRPSATSALVFAHFRFLIQAQ